MFKSIFLSFIYVYSFSILNGLFVAYGIGNSQFFLHHIIWASVPALGFGIFLLIFQPYDLIIKYLLYVFATFWNIFIVSHSLMFGTLTDVPTIYVSLNSGGGEIKYFLETFVTAEIICIILILILVPLFFLNLSKDKKTISSLNNKENQYTTKDRIILFALSLLVFMIPMHRDGFLPEGLKWRNGISISSIERNFRKLYYIEYTGYLPLVSQIGKLDISDFGEVKSLIEDEPQNVILVIMESSNRNLFSLYGYPRKTTPKLDKLYENSDLIVYPNVLSPAPVSATSISRMLTFSNLENTKQITTIYDFFKKAGFETYNLAGYRGVHYNDIIHIIGRRADYVYNAKTDDTDGLLFEKALDIIENKTAKKKLIVIQTWLAHFPYEPPYPSEIIPFTDMPPNLLAPNYKNLRNKYDTALLYLDLIISDFIKDIEQLDNTVLLVTADHGEEVGNYGTPGRSNSSTNVACFEVPFHLFITDNYKEKLNKLTFDTSRPYQTDNLLHSLIDLSLLESPLFVQEYSIFNSLYKEPQLKIQSYNYEEVKARMEEKRRNELKE